MKWLYKLWSFEIYSNHLTQMLAVTTMEPREFEPEQ